MRKRDIVMGTTIVVLLFLVGGTYYLWKNSEANYKGSTDYIASLNDTLEHLRNGVVRKQAVEVSRDLFEKIIRERDDLQRALKDAGIKAKNVQSFTGVITDVDLGKAAIKMPLRDTMPCPDMGPVRFGAIDPNYKIVGWIEPGSVWIDTLSLPDSISIITATKSHLFKPSEFNVLVRHSNPLIKTTGAMNLTVKEQRKPWQNGWVKFGAGLVTGAFLISRF